MKFIFFRPFRQHNAVLTSLFLCMTLTLSSCINRADRWTGSPGLILEQENEVTRVNRIVPETLRGNGTLLEGDIIQSVNGVSTAGLPVGDIVKHLKGLVGSTVDVVVQRGQFLVTLRIERVMLTDPARRILWVEQISAAPLLPQPPDTEAATSPAVEAAADSPSPKAALDPDPYQNGTTDTRSPSDTDPGSLDEQQPLP